MLANLVNNLRNQVFTTGEDYHEDLWRMFRGIKLVGEIEENSKYLYFYEYYNEGILGVEYDAVVATKDRGEVERIYLYKIA